MASIEQYGGRANVQESGLKLYYMHANNGDKGDGSINNPFGTFDLLLDFLDTNNVVAGATIIVLGGTFNVTRNIYRGHSFYFFPGTKLICDIVGDGALLYDESDYEKSLRGVSATNGFDSDFFFKGEVEVIINNGFFANLGFWASNSDRTNGKKWSFDFYQLKMYSPTASQGIFLLYTSVGYSTIPLQNTYDVKIRNVISDSSYYYGPLFYGAQAAYTPDGEGDIANSGVALYFESDYVNLSIYECSTSNLGWIGRNTTFKIKQFNLGDIGFIYRGSISLQRKCILNLEIQFIYANLDGSNIIQVNEVSSGFLGFIIYKGTQFLWNTAIPQNQFSGFYIVNSNSASNIKVYCQNCQLPAPPENLVFKTDKAGVQSVFSLANNTTPVTIASFSTINQTLYYSIINS